jgi:hypothetical protein
MASSWQDSIKIKLKMKCFWNVSIAKSEGKKGLLDFYIWFSMCSHKIYKRLIKALYFIFGL